MDEKFWSTGPFTAVSHDCWYEINRKRFKCSNRIAFTKTSRTEEFHENYRAASSLELFYANGWADNKVATFV